MEERDLNRMRLKQLDRCLHELEDANEANQRVVADSVATRLRLYVPAVVPGMAVSQAINLVLAEQEQYLPGPSSLVPGMQESDEPPLDVDGARNLTEQIKRATRQVCLLLFEAHRRRAWQALGYASWDAYIQGEFGLSRSRSYELLDQGRVIRAMMAAAGISGIPEISAYAAEQIKPYLPEVIEAVRRLTAGLTEQDALPIVIQVVGERRRLIAEERERTRLPEPREDNQTELARLQQVIERLASMPPVVEVIEKVEAGGTDHLQRVDEALGWLTEFAAELRKRQIGTLPYAMAPASRNGN